MLSSSIQGEPNEYDNYNNYENTAVNESQKDFKTNRGLGVSLFNINVNEKKVFDLEGKKLYFEKFLEEDDEVEGNNYKHHIVDIYRNPRDIVPVLNLAKYLLSRGCGEESLGVLFRALECIEFKEENKIFEIDITLLYLLTVKMLAKYVGEYAYHKLIRECARNFANSTMVIGNAARYLHVIKISKSGEELYLAALLLDPLNPEALRGYALMLAEAGNFPLAFKYISRIQSSAVCYSIAKTEKGWILEIMGEIEASLQSFQNVLAMGLKDRATSYSLTALGHMFHVRGDFQRALSFYTRALMCSRNNQLALILRACLCASMKSSYLLNSNLESENYFNTDEICANFRKGLFFLKGNSKWLGLLSYGETAAYILNDSQRAESILWNASIESIGRTIWSGIALIHFYQYFCDKCSTARRVSIWAEKMRFENNYSGEQGGNEQMLEDFVAFNVVSSHLALQMDNLEDARSKVMSALELDPDYSPALRCLAIIEWVTSSNKQKALQIISKSVTHISPDIIKNSTNKDNVVVYNGECTYLLY